MGSSYIAFVTAFLAVQFDNPAAWILPTLVGSQLIQRSIGRALRTAAVAPPPDSFAPGREAA